MAPRLRMGVRPIGRDEGRTCVTGGWISLIDRVYDAVEATPGVEVCWVSQRLGLLSIECVPRQIPAGLLWRLAAIERLSARICQVCALPGRPMCPERPIHWPADEIRIYCRYHADCAEMGMDVHAMVDERLSVLTNATLEARPILFEDVAAFSPEQYREGLVWLSEATPCDAGEGCVYPQRVEWVLDQASDAQLAACQAGDFERFFSWDDMPSVKAAALQVLSRLRTNGRAFSDGDPSPTHSDDTR